MDWEFGVVICKLLHLEWINKVLMYITDNYIQYPMINHNRKEYLKEQPNQKVGKRPKQTFVQRRYIDG